MRDPNRIPRIIETLSRLWQARPDMRLAQIIVTAGNLSGASDDNMYNVEDEDLEAGMQRYLGILRDASRL